VLRRLGLDLTQVRSRLEAGGRRGRPGGGGDEPAHTSHAKRLIENASKEAREARSELTSDHLLYTAQYPTAFNKTARQCGILLDEWTEVIPATTRDTGIAFNFDRPNNEAPQSLLLVTPGTANGEWQWEDLMGALNETLDLAKSRAVEPVHIDGTAYSRFLPATIMAATLYGISITTALAATNGVYRSLGATTRA